MKADHHSLSSSVFICGFKAFTLSKSHHRLWRQTRVNADATRPLVGVIMGSRSDWETMAETARTLEGLGVPFEVRVISAHRTPDALFEYAASAEDRGLEVIIAAAGGAAHLAGVTAAKTLLPVLGVPMESRALKGMDSLLSIAQMPGGIPVGTLAVGKPGARNAGLLAASILALGDSTLQHRLEAWRARQTASVAQKPI
jgi:5-(carboxyamino)imidazole ribonucleotide mutase